MRGPTLALLAVVGCTPSPDSVARNGSNHGHENDSADAAVDAPQPPDADPNVPVDIFVRSAIGDGLPDTTAVVVFTDPSGSTLQVTTVDATGHASALMPNGGSITVVQTLPQSQYSVLELLSTIRGVEPGDHIIQGRARDLSRRAGALSYMTVNYTPPSNMGYPYLITACADTSSSSPYDGHVTLIFHESCVNPSFELLAIGDDTAGGRSFMWRPQYAYVDGGSIDLAAAWQPTQTTTTLVSHIPANTSLGVRLSTLVDGVPVEMDRKWIDPVLQSSYTVNLLYPYVPGMRTMLYANTQHGLTNPFTDVTIVSDQSPASIPIDMTAHPLPVLSFSPTISATGISWTETGTRGAPDARTAIWGGRWVDANSVTHSVSWTFIEPPTLTTTLTLPSLPPQLASHDPTRVTSGLVISGGGLEYVDYDNISSYSQARLLGWRFAATQEAYLDVDHAVYRSRSYRN